MNVHPNENEVAEPFSTERFGAATIPMPAQIKFIA
jgi:hypothetical protein